MKRITMNKRHVPGAALAVLLSAIGIVQTRAQAPASVPAATPSPAARPSTAAPSVETAWPYVIKAGTTTLTVYQPQLESFDGYTLQARAAAAACEGQGKTNTYGVIHLTARAIVDKDRRTVALDRYQVVKADFPSAPDRAGAWKAALQKEADTRTKTISLDRIEAAMGAMEAQKKAERQALRNDPPAILFSTTPALLVYIDGAPAYRPVSGTHLERVINTRPLLLKEPDGRHYLHLFDGWMTSSAIQGPYTRLSGQMPDLEKAQQAAVAERQVDLLTGQAGPEDKGPSLAGGPIPAIHVATTPTELVVTEGEPRWVPIRETNLLYAENTTGHVFKEAGGQDTWLLVSGRWFKAPDVKGRWEFVAANKLPEDFASIPDDSPRENVKAAVAGTPQAREAAIAAEIPQTSAVKTQEATMTPPKFDGAPKLEAIPTTSLQYVANSATPIIRTDAGRFYAVQNGVWFVAASLDGPWAVATSVPAAIYSIPPSSPLHYVTYVKVYDSTPDTVVVGYTPGYLGSYVDPETDVVVYGTGYPYTPWIDAAWYGPPLTYGFGAAVRYTPWTGWSYGFGFGRAWGTATPAAGWGWGAYPWWGPYATGAAYGYRGAAAAWEPGRWAGTTGNIYSQWGPRATVNRYTGGANAWTGSAWAGRVGASYNSRTGVASAGQRGAVQNVYTGGYATGARGVAAGRTATVYTGGEVTARRASAYSPITGRGGSAASIRGSEGGVTRVGDDLYAGHDGNVYRKTDNGWQQRTGSGWNQANLDATRDLGRHASARWLGSARTQSYRSASGAMNRSFGGMHAGSVRATSGMRAGGGRRR